jgi:hypothetical protein
MKHTEKTEEEKYQEKQQEIKNQFVEDLTLHIDDYIHTLPSKVNTIISETVSQKYYVIQEIISYYYQKYCKKIDNINNFDIRVEFLIGDIYTVKIIERKKLKEIE